MSYELSEDEREQTREDAKRERWEREHGTEDEDTDAELVMPEPQEGDYARLFGGVR